MKTVLLPTDFSENAFTAIKYAIDFHKGVPMRFVLLFSYELPIGNSGAFISISDMIEKFKREDMAETLDRIKALQPESHHKFESHITYGKPVPRVMAFVKRKNAGLIVMGTKGASGVKKILLGSNASALLRRSHCPVLVVPEDCEFETPHKIGLASDLKPLSDKSLIDPLVAIVSRFDSELMVLHASSEGETDLTEKEKKQRHELKDQFKSINESFHFIENENPLAGIQEFTKENDIKLLAMITRKSSLLKKLFHQSTVEKMVFESHVPLLAIHN